MRRDLPSGAVTFLFTDVEGSTKLLHELGAEAYAEKLAEHRRIVREACTARGGVEVDTQGDALFVAFPTAPDALEAAHEITAGLASGAIALRIGLHTGTPLLTDEGYVGDDVHFAARVAASAHGGQVVLSPATRALLDERYSLIDLGEHRLKDIPEPVAIFQLGDGQFPPLKTISNTNLPRPASSFVGRERELQELLARIESGARLVTVTGPGGSGKTRLALEAAATLVPEYKAGVFWVGLASLRDPALVTETIGQTLGAKDGLADHIGEREMLLLLDNLEQVIEAAPELSSTLQRCPNLTLLATSRELLRVQGEMEYAVPPLAEAEGISLFCERAQTAASDEIAELCRRLDSLPLAVELAAARTKALSPAQILDRLSQRLDLLKGGRDADPRQQTLRATMAWSYDLLSEEEQRLFRRLAVFSGGCTLEAAEEVAEAELDTLQSLVEKSLLRFSNERYWMLETIREYAAERLEEAGEGEELRRRHGMRFALYAERGEEELQRGLEWLENLDADHDNIRRALVWASETAEWTVAMRAVWGLWRFWFLRGHIAEGRRWVERVLAADAEAEPLVRARTFVAAGELAMRQGDLDRAQVFKQKHLALFRAEGRDEEVARTLASLGNLAADTGDFERARSLFAEALAIHRRRGDTFGIAHSTVGLGYLALVQGDLDLARSHHQTALALFRELRNREYAAQTLLGLGEVCTLLGELGAARASLAEALTMTVEDDIEFMKFACLEQVARFAASAGEAATAATLWGATETLGEAMGAGALDQDRERFLESVKRRLSDEELDAAWARGALLEPQEAVAVALEGLAHTAPLSAT